MKARAWPRKYSTTDKAAISDVIDDLSEAVPLNSGQSGRQGQWQPEGTILIVDDDENIRLVTSAMVEGMGFNAMSARGGLEALDLYHRHQDEITGVLMDLGMPEMDGGECCRELLNMDPTVKIILASGYHERDTVARFAERGLTGFIQKPYSQAALKTVLETALRSR